MCRQTSRIVASIFAVVVMFSTLTHASQRVSPFGGAVERAAFSRLSASFNHTCLVTADGAVKCWGGNEAGKLGDGTDLNRAFPVSVTVEDPNRDPLLSVVAVSAAPDHTCALKSDSTVWCWGDNSAGQLGFDTGTLGQQRRAGQVTGLSLVVAITAGKGFTCALRYTGTVACWGVYLDTIAPLPNNVPGFTVTSGTTPRTVSGLSGVTGIAAGDNHMCALLDAGTVSCWGDNDKGQLGMTFTGSVWPLPNAVTGDVSGFSLLSRVRQISAQGNVTCAVLADSTARCWGASGLGQLGDPHPTVDGIGYPVTVQSLINAVEIRASSQFVCALLAQGTVTCWGLVPDGVPGLGATAVAGLQNVAAVSAGAVHACALVADGTVKCFGSSADGQLGAPSVSASTTPVAVANLTGSVNAVGVATGGDHTCAVRANGLMACWGTNTFGEIGDGTSGGNRLLPVAVTGVSNVTGAALGSMHSCAVMADGTLRCWGRNNDGQVGTGATSIDEPVPGVVSGLAGVVAVAPSTFHTCALLVDGTVKCWGLGTSGELGNSNFFTRLTPETVVSSADRSEPLRDVVAIASSSDSTCALIVDGTERCWGSNADDDLGDGVDGGRASAATPVDGLTAAIAVSGSCVLLSSGRMDCWGKNENGQVGDGSIVNRSGPVSAGISSGVSIARSALHACSGNVIGLAFCWGDNVGGELGDGTFSDRHTPVAVSNMTAVTGMGAGNLHTCALRVNGRVSCWGFGLGGQLGNNGTANSPLPVDVPSFTLNINPSVALEGNARKAIVNVIAVCDLGSHISVDVELTQWAVTGKGHGHADCAGALMQFPVAVEAQGADPFTGGPAQVSADALIQKPGTVDRQEWTRAVQIASTAFDAGSN